MLNPNLSTSALPFVMIDNVQVPNADRGYALYPSGLTYNPLTQTSNLYHMGGATNPTTYSMVGSTGIISTDTDESSDDRGND